MLKEVKVNKYKGSFILKISLFSLIVFVLATLINQQITISEMTDKLDSTNMMISEQLTVNEELQYSIDEGRAGGDVFAENYARSELNYAKQGERVFVNIGGN